MPRYYTNCISLPTDGNDYTIENSSDTGWYVLYRPEIGETGIPTPIYHVQGQDDFIGWTTFAPAGCLGSSNYPTGKAELVLQRVEENLTSVVLSHSSNTKAAESADTIEITGNCIKPLVYVGLYEDREMYCFYKFGQGLCNKNTIVDDNFIISNGWFLGHLRYRGAFSGVAVKETVFGTPLVAILRTIGLYANLVSSFYGRVVYKNKVEGSKVENDLNPAVPSIVFNSSTQEITTNMTGELYLQFNVASFGQVTATNAKVVRNEYMDAIVYCLEGGSVVSLIGITFASYPVTIVATLGNVQETFYL